MAGHLLGSTFTSEVRKCHREGQVWPGTPAGRGSDARGPTTCSASLVTDNPGLLRAPPGAQTGAVHRQRILLLPTTLRTGWAGEREARACAVNVL